MTGVPDRLEEAEKEPPPVTLQVTPMLLTSLVTVAVTERVCVSVSPPRLGEIETAMAGPVAGVEAVAVLEKVLTLPATSLALTR